MSEGGFEVVDDLPREDIGIGKIVGFFEAFVSKGKNVAAGFGAVETKRAGPDAGAVVTRRSHPAVKNQWREPLKPLGSKVKQLSESKVEGEQVVACCLSSPGHLLS